MYRIPDPHLDRIALARHAHIRVAQLTQQIQWRLWFLAQSQPQGILLTSLPHRFLHVLGQAIETIRRACAIDPLMRPLVVVVVDPVIDPLTRIGE